jgi:predicted mannosyl-3-phosphoglycerate phosphatase (HAD superfamily)
MLVVSDLDGTLLDHTTYAFDAARAALERLRDARVPLVLCTSKTRAEVEPIRAALGSAHPFEVAAETGLTLSEARLARQREFDEPFVVLEPERAPALFAAIEREGKRWTTGGRFHHITGTNDKAAAVRLLVGLYRHQLGDVLAVGLGDAPNDAEFLREVDVPILIASPRVDQLRALVPGGRVTTLEGPAGWNAAVLALLDERR